MTLVYGVSPEVFRRLPPEDRAALIAASLGQAPPSIGALTPPSAPPVTPAPPATPPTTGGPGTVLVPVNGQTTPPNPTAAPTLSPGAAPVGPADSSSTRRLAIDTQASSAVAASSPNKVGGPGGNQPIFLGRGHGLGYDPQGYEVIRLLQPMTAYRYYGGRVPKAGSVFLTSLAVDTAMAEVQYGAALPGGERLDYRVAVTIPAGVVVRVGVTAPGKSAAGAAGVFGGAPMVQLVDPQDVGRVAFGTPRRLAQGGGPNDFPFGDGPRDPAAG